jgi:hypothetical protein
MRGIQDGNGFGIVQIITGLCFYLLDKSVYSPGVSIFPGLFTVNFDCDIRTGDRAQGAPRAFPAVLLENDRPVPPGIVFMGWGDQTLFTGMDAQMAFLAKLPVDRDMSLQLYHLLYRGFLQVIVGP